jgi:hypothetical protein
MLIMVYVADPQDHPVVKAISTLLDRLIDHFSGVDELGDLAGAGVESIFNFAIEHLKTHKEQRIAEHNPGMFECHGCD